MPSNSIIERVVRHRLPTDQLDQLVDMLIVMLEAPDSQVRLSYEDGGSTVSATVPSAAFELILDALSLLASRPRMAVLAVDDGVEVTVHDICKAFDKGHLAVRARLSKFAVPESARKNGRGTWYLFEDVIDAFRREQEETPLLK